MADMPCAGMDIEKPVHCASQHSGAQLTLDYLATAAAPAPIASFIMPASMPLVPAIPASSWIDTPLQAGAAPPYLRTQRLRI